MHRDLVRHPDGFPRGYTALIRAGERLRDTGMHFGIMRLAAGESFARRPSLETVFLLLDGKVMFEAGDVRGLGQRESLFDQAPSALHVAAGTDCRLEAATDCELAVAATANSGTFPPAFFDASSMLESEHRDKGLLDDASYRIVRTIFDTRNRAGANLVLGEVVNFPGRWSSFPPHHHPQPEIYHYRFTHPSGFGYCQLGDDVLRVRGHDTVKILDGNDHPQVAAPGYGMFYIWVIRHLPGLPYTVPEFTADHVWLKQPDAPVWRPKT